MVPPPITPASRRFLPPPSTDKPYPTSRPPSLPKQQAFTPEPNSFSRPQFASTPRFTFGSSNEKASRTDTLPRQLHSFSSSPFAAPRHGTLEPVAHYQEDIEEPSSYPEDTSDLREPTEQDPIRLSDDPNIPHIAAPRKRRRVQPPPATNEERIVISSSPTPSASPPVTPHLAAPKSPSPPSTPPPLQLHSTATSIHPRFRFSLPSHPSPPSTSAKPSFILPTAPQSPPTSLPSALASPHRRARKYTPGGLASTVRDWVFETSQDASRGRSFGSGNEGESWDIKLEVAEVKTAEMIGGGVTLLHEAARHTEGHSSRGWVLMGKPMRDYGNAGVDISISKGALIGIKKPTWEVELLNHEIWHVGVEWMILTG